MLFQIAIHHTNLTQSGIYQIQNANLGALAKDKVWLSCTIILPLRAQGDSLVEWRRTMTISLEAAAQAMREAMRRLCDPRTAITALVVHTVGGPACIANTCRYAHRADRPGGVGNC